MASDVSRALLLPDIDIPSDRLLKTLAVYWDELVLPDYRERADSGDGTRSEFDEPTDALIALESNGVLIKLERTIELPTVEPSLITSGIRDLLDDPSKARALAITSPLLELLEPIESDALKRYMETHKEEVATALDEMTARMVDYAVDHYAIRMKDAFHISTTQHLAPLARSPVSHLASMVGPPADAPRSEAAILSAVIQAFEVDPSTPVDRIIRFREKNAGSLGRFRASLVDLSESLRQDADATRLLSEARDVYRNRVVPALGDLETVLQEGKIRFLIKSLLGATAVTMAPVEPTRAVEGTATLIGQSIDYSFSRNKLVQEHPFGYLHQVSKDFNVTDAALPSPRQMDMSPYDPLQEIRALFRQEFEKGRQGAIMDRLWWSQSRQLREEAQ